MTGVISHNWGWLGLEALEIINDNDFGNVIFVDSARRFWRICPEELSCEMIAESRASYDSLMGEDEFRQDWLMAGLVEQAQARYGKQPEGSCFCLKRPAVFGGEYAIENIGTVSRRELVAFAGDVARQLKDVSDGEKVELTWAG